MFESSQYEGVTRAQSDLLNYWDAIRGGRALPHRDDIDPGQIRAHLASISILKLSGKNGIQFRLVGSKVRSSFRDLQQEISQDPLGIWGARLVEVAETRTPLHGISDRNDMRHAWLRLPLDAGRDQHCHILCYDALLTAQTQLDKSFQSRTLSDTQASIAA